MQQISPLSIAAVENLSCTSMTGNSGWLEREPLQKLFDPAIRKNVKRTLVKWRKSFEEEKYLYRMSPNCIKLSVISE